MDDKKILLFRPRYTQRMLILMMRKNVERKSAMIIVMKDAKAILYGRKAKHSSRCTKGALNKKRF